MTDENIWNNFPKGADLCGFGIPFQQRTLFLSNSVFTLLNNLLIVGIQFLLQ